MYTGLPQTPCTASWTSTGADAEGAALSVSHSGNVNVGTANASATFLGDANHTGSSNSATFAITKATLDVDAQDASKTYGDLDPAFEQYVTRYQAILEKLRIARSTIQACCGLASNSFSSRGWWGAETSTRCGSASAASSVAKPRERAGTLERRRDHRPP